MVILRRFVETEKSASLVDQSKYVFQVSPSATKKQVADAVAREFGVKVIKINVMNRLGKKKRAGKARKLVKRPDIKLAVVTLKSGEKLDLSAV